MRVIIIPNLLVCWEGKCDDVWKFFTIHKFLCTCRTQVIVTICLTLREPLKGFDLAPRRGFTISIFEIFWKPQHSCANSLVCPAALDLTFWLSTPRRHDLRKLCSDCLPGKPLFLRGIEQGMLAMKPHGWHLPVRVLKEAKNSLFKPKWAICWAPGLI